MKNPLLSQASPVPAAETRNAREELHEEILKGLEGQIKTPRIAFGYQFGMLFVALANMLLPLIYFGLIFLVGHAVYWHIFHNLPDGTATSGKEAKLQGLLFMLPIVMGITTLVFMVKPLFARDPKESKPLVLKRKAEPFLFEYVKAVCRSVKAPVPHSIVLMCEPNASASFSRGFWGLLTGRMTLTIGLPLVSGMTVSQLTGVLAHEFGHFSQRSGLRICYLISTLNGWMYKIVFLRDKWDEKLEQWSRRGNMYFWLFAKVSLFCIWLSRQLMFGLLWVSNSISCYFMRQMEFDADRFQARLVGVKTVKSTFRRITELSVAHSLAVHDLSRFHTEGRLADDLPMLIVSNVSQITPEIRKRVRAAEREQETGLFDTHPTDRERIESLGDEPDVGLFQLPKGKDPAATVLFGNFELICRRMTTEFYETALGPIFNKSMLRPVKELIAHRDAEICGGQDAGPVFSDSRSDRQVAGSV
ncbi:MAG: M48 family metallopeptidase [Planctomycetales bacterium]